ncbi:hypothetical protein GCM10007385_27320 [Tateyamaria omphalii]|uniref:hypothetical protein n=1 Tax=Tateyamaria omphalii TaxID=299262 RepID=UPI00167B73A4|nr:hypothetical protein [Tateyamaria omphalii]GGX57036.1 hypothetical protein GCM10007385_27320 [Tateyamaria omphalii]
MVGATAVIAIPAVSKPGIVSVEVDRVSGVLTVFNYTNCDLTAVAATANATIAPKSKFKAKREEPSDAYLGQFWFWGEDTPAVGVRFDEAEASVRRFPPHKELTSPFIPAGYEADDLTLDRVEVYTGKTALHESPPSFAHLPGLNDPNTSNWTSNVLLNQWSWKDMSANKVRGEWTIQATNAQLEVEACKP